MVGAIAAILIAIWYYKEALVSGKNPISSAALGALVYFIPAVLWSLTVTPGLRDTVEHSQGIALALIVRYGYVAIGVICAIWVKPRHFAKRKVKTD